MVFLISTIYLSILILTIVRILLDTRSTPKTLAYLLLVIVFPVVGIVFYYAVGINLRHRQSKTRMAIAQKELDADFFTHTKDETNEPLENYFQELAQYSELVKFLHKMGGEILSENYFKLLENGEVKFPEVLATLEQAESFIHIEYYDWENDIRGNQIKDILLKKASEGVQVRVLYDDYASRKIKRNIVRELKSGGVAVFPKIKVKLKHFANRMNHRDHRKVIIVDGKYGFVGGINISDRYDNSIDTGLWWRDTHTRVSGKLALSLQRHFIVSWNSSQTEKLSYSSTLFPEESLPSKEGVPALAQVVAGGPVYPLSNIMLTYFKIFNLANKSLYITNPYFIPNESILDALKQAALSGVDVRIMVPKKSDSMIVGLSANSFFEELLDAGVRIFLYTKGFVHAKTVVADQKLSVVGTANMDIRSFDLNFEIMSVIYSDEFAGQMENMFFRDLKECKEIDPVAWKNRGLAIRLVENTARLVSAFL
jgi:cardiolipin synthase